MSATTINNVHTYKLEAIFAELLCQQQSAKDCKPCTPAEHLLHLLYVHHPKDKDELVEHKVPELVTHVLGKKGGRKGGMRRGEEEREGGGKGGGEEREGEGGGKGGDEEGWRRKVKRRMSERVEVKHSPAAPCAAGSQRQRSR